MSDVTIERLHAEYHDVTAEHAVRFDQAFGAVGATLLDAALAEVGLPDLHAVCVDEIALSIELDPTEPVDRLATAWALDLAYGIRRHLDSGSTGVMVFEREIDAAVEFVRNAVVPGRLDQAWVWQQLGYASHGRSTSLDDVVDFCRRSPELVLAALRICIVDLSRSLSGADWIVLANAIARASNRSGVASLLADPIPGEVDTDPVSGSLIERVGGSVGPTSAPAVVLLASATLQAAWAVASAADRAALVAAAVLLAEPARSGDRETLAATFRAVNEAFERSIDAELSATDGTADAHAERAENVSNATAPLTPSPSAGADAETASAAESSVQSSPTREAPRAVPESTDLRSMLVTDAGGVFFVISVLKHLEVVDQLAVAAPENVLDLLARALEQLTGVSRVDPAILTVAGIDISDPAQRETLHAPLAADLADVVDDACHRVLDWLDESVETDEPGSFSWEWLWARHAAIDLQVGWIEIDFASASADIRIRRLGLDLDPGFVWWLGAIVRFRYVS